MKTLLWIMTLSLSASVFSSTNLRPEQQLTVVTEEVPVEYVSNNKSLIDGLGTPAARGIVPSGENPSRIETAGRVISMAQNMVALGEAIYDLVKKGKPSNTTEYAPISVVPRDPMTKEIADLFDLEGFSFPVEKAYVSRVKNAAGKEVVTFSYKVIFSYGGSYNGVGQYLTGVMIVPQSVKTTLGWEFNATMKLTGMMNHGSKANPVAGVMLTIKYQMNGWNAAYERNDTIHITGAGQFKNHMAQ